MPRIVALLLLFTGITQADSEAPVALAIHGGAGTILKKDLGAEKEAAIREQLEQALRAGYAVLQKNGTALEAVTTAITRLEDSPLFNAGKGAVYTYTGDIRLDASIMTGGDRDAGAVAGVSRIRNPILAARAVMERSPHVLLSGDGAETFARRAELEMVEPDYFKTEFRERQWLKARSAATAASDKSGLWYSTVGAVALDRNGNLAAGTSTGGMLNKRWGRVGDSPIIGAGTYADNRVCAVSATGHGEFFIRAAVAHDICARALYQQRPLAEVAREVILRDLPAMGASGGVITLDPKGNAELVFNTEGMYRGSIDVDGNLRIRIYREDGN